MVVIITFMKMLAVFFSGQDQNLALTRQEGVDSISLFIHLFAENYIPYVETKILYEIYLLWKRYRPSFIIKSYNASVFVMNNFLCLK